MPSQRLAALGRSALAVALCAVLTLPAAAQDFPDEWFFTNNNGKREPDHVAFEGNAAPELTVTGWVNGEVTPEDREGKIVVIDFWATWCQPCIAAIPHKNELAERYADEGVVFLAVCASGDPELMPGILKDNGAEYPSAFVEGDQVNLDWPLGFFPTYAVVDAAGTVRAIGIKPGDVASVVDALLEEQADATGRARIPRAWLEGDQASRERLANLEDNADAPPAIQADTWINTHNDAGLTDEDLQGKVVLLSFGATWAAPWLDTLEELNALHEEFAEQGLVVVGVCATLEGFALPNVAEQYGIAFPACVDTDNLTNRAYGPNGYPDYYLLGRAGHLRAADLGHDHLRDAIQALLAEEPPATEEEPEEEPTDAESEGEGDPENHTDEDADTSDDTGDAENTDTDE